MHWANHSPCVWREADDGARTRDTWLGKPVTGATPGAAGLRLGTSERHLTRANGGQPQLAEVECFSARAQPVCNPLGAVSGGEQ
jgi:hypothetical protein